MLEFKSDIDDNGTYNITLSGKFTFSDHANFKQLFESFADDKVNQVVVDMADVEFIDSAGLGILLLARDEGEKASVKLSLKEPKGQVKKMFEVSRFYEFFDIVE